MTSDRFARLTATTVVPFWLVVGGWAMLAPHSFYVHVATFEPYNRHFLHDVGAFSIGLGAVLVFALMRWSALGATLAGVAVASLLHELSHLVDHRLGGRDSDVVLLGVLALVTVAGAVAARPRKGPAVAAHRPVEGASR